jgi:RHS repeat-associated protein
VSLPGQGAITMSDFRWTRPQTTTYPGGAIRSEQYDAIQRTRQITVHAGSETRMDWRYTYDATGNITRIDTEHGRYAFAYDALDRLIEADYPNGPQHDQINASFAPNTFPFADDRYSYDPIGNRLSSQSQPGPWAYNGNSELIQSPFGTTTFNLAGSTTEERTPTEQLIRRFAYDTEERPTEVTNAQGQRIARYYHDPFGRRLWKTLESRAEGHSGGPAPETIYLAYNDEGYAAEFRLPGTPDTAPTQGPSSYSTLWVHEPDGLWSTGAIAIRIDGNWRYPQHDHLATPRMVIDGQGAVTTTIRMNAFGETRHLGEAIANRFPGQVFDVETGLHYNYFRSYQPRTGRYTQADPIGLSGGLNMYAYSVQNPARLVDPYGLRPLPAIGLPIFPPGPPCAIVDAMVCCVGYSGRRSCSKFPPPPPPPPPKEICCDGYYDQVGSVNLPGVFSAALVCRCIWLCRSSRNHTAWSGNPQSPGLPTTLGFQVGPVSGHVRPGRDGGRAELDEGKGCFCASKPSPEYQCCD